MPFEKGNTLWKDSVKARRRNNDKLAAFFEMITSGGIEEYGDKLDRLASDIKLSKNELEFMNRFEAFVPYIKSKAVQKSEVEVTLPKQLADV